MLLKGLRWCSEGRTKTAARLGANRVMAECRNYAAPAEAYPASRGRRAEGGRPDAHPRLFHTTRNASQAVPGRTTAIPAEPYDVPSVSGDPSPQSQRTIMIMAMAREV